ncbi:putative Hemopexin-like domain-containing protein [Rosa chinensis]|uniref:Putative Hemopexin-like domain-containing protein n=1 Tax=Rosa chinensis TaxID=74649 RepID=A0A2P6QLS7_ROSCH|nr:putative Hemopexin-like domain-containing protein [Rosa chinensis]
MTISAMFPFFKSTVFSTDIDAAFEAATKYEAYLFKDNQYALINYGSGSACLIHLQLIIDSFHGLRNTIFASGIEAAFASRRTNEAYLFKRDSYALINFSLGNTNDYIIGGVKKILPNWPSLQPILPSKNYGLDVHNHSSLGVDDVGRNQDHDEL